MNEMVIYFNYFLCELKEKLDMEKAICETNNYLMHFNMKWATILGSL